MPFLDTLFKVTHVLRWVGVASLSAAHLAPFSDTLFGTLGVARSLFFELFEAVLSHFLGSLEFALAVHGGIGGKFEFLENLWRRGWADEHSVDEPVAHVGE